MQVEGMVCPKCGYNQDDTFECHRCGVIFHKYRERDRAAPATPRGNAASRLLLRHVIVGVGIVAVAALLVSRWQTSRPIVHGAGIIAPHMPRQRHLQTTVSFRYNDYLITPLAGFDIEARVLAMKRYTGDRESELAPYDVVLGWGKMSDEAVLNAIHITQSNRFYHWWTDRFPLPRRAIEVNSANMHLIPANPDIAKRLAHVRQGHVMTITGFLVRADTSDWHWVSSLTRQDTGVGACELIWVQDVAVH